MTLVRNIWSSYIITEKSMIDFLRIIPYDEENKAVWSPVLANMYLVVGSQIDSIFRNFADTYYISLIKNNYTLKKKKKDYIITDFKNLYDHIYGFSNDIVYLLDFKKELYPWKNWDCSKNPDWWIMYNKVKHDRFKNLERATLENVLLSLSGLFLLCVKFHQMLVYLVDKTIIKGDDEPSLIKDRILNSEPGKMTYLIRPAIAKTNLFGYIYTTMSKYCKEDPWKCLSGAGRAGQITDQVYSF